jgi:hypothetical protein
MPAAWAQYLAEGPQVNELWSRVACSPSIIEIFGRDSLNIATGEILGYHESVDSQGYRHGVASVRVLARLKGAADWKIGETRDVPVFSEAGHENPKLRAGSQLMFFGGLDRSIGMQINPGYACPAVSVNETNLGLVRRGIAQDDSAMNKTE